MEKVCSIHRACKVISLSKDGFYYKLKQRDDSAIIASLNQNVEATPPGMVLVELSSFQEPRLPMEPQKSF